MKNAAPKRRAFHLFDSEEGAYRRSTCVTSLTAPLSALVAMAA